MNIISAHVQPAIRRIHGTLHLQKPTASAEVDPAARLDLTQDTKTTKTTHASEPALPHERDEQVGMTGGIANPVVQQGARDLKRGIQDTSKSVETNVAYAKLKQP